MAQMSKHHQELTNGEGKCSMPMWSNGCPAGFCDEPAFGGVINGSPNSGYYENGRFFPRYVPGLACFHHGGPKENREATDAKS